MRAFPLSHNYTETQIVWQFDAGWACCSSAGIPSGSGDFSVLSCCCCCCCCCCCFQYAQLLIGVVVVLAHRGGGISSSTSGSSSFSFKQLSAEHRKFLPSVQDIFLLFQNNPSSSFILLWWPGVVIFHRFYQISDIFSLTCPLYQISYLLALVFKPTRLVLL